MFIHVVRFISSQFSISKTNFGETSFEQISVEYYGNTCMQLLLSIKSLLLVWI